MGEQEVRIVRIERQGLPRNFTGALVIAELTQGARQLKRGFQVRRVEVVGFGPEGRLGEHVLTAHSLALARRGRHDRVGVHRIDDSLFLFGWCRGRAACHKEGAERGEKQ